MSNVKRWQFTLRGIIGYTALIALPFGAWLLISRFGGGPPFAPAYLAAMYVTGGAIGSTVGWLMQGTGKGFWLGYISGWLAIFVLAAIALIFASNI